MKVSWICVPAAAIVTLLISSTALAGGWAVTTLDPVPKAIQAGQTYHIGYLIRQHGVTPVQRATPRIVVTAGNQRLSFPGIADGAAGHYVSEVTFPSEGEWTWEIDQAPFPQIQALGSLTVQPGTLPALRPQPPVELIAVLSLLILVVACGALVLVYSSPRFRESAGWVRACLGQSMRRARVA